MKLIRVTVKYQQLSLSNIQRNDALYLLTENVQNTVQHKCSSYLDECHMSPQCRWRMLAHSQLRAQRASLDGGQPAATVTILYRFFRHVTYV